MRVSQLLRQAEPKVEWVKANELKEGDIVFPRYLISKTSDPAEIVGPPRSVLDPMIGIKVLKFPAKAKDGRTGDITLGPAGSIRRLVK